MKLIVPDKKDQTMVSVLKIFRFITKKYYVIQSAIFQAESSVFFFVPVKALLNTLIGTDSGRLVTR